jgi:trigger factor
MQVTQISGDGLSRIYGVTIPATELGAKLDAKIAEIAPKLRLKGFRPGKVPAAHVRRIYGKALMGELVQETLSESSQKVVEDAGLRIAAQPSLNPQSDLEEVIAGRQDLAFQLDVEVMPDFEPADVASLELVRLVHEPTDE